MRTAATLDVRVHALPMPPAPTVPGLAAGELRCGDLEVKLADCAAEIDAAQALRYRVFYDEMKARSNIDAAASQRDIDAFDQVCDHLIVCDQSRGADAVVGTYRLIRREAAARLGRFYTEGEFDIAVLRAFPGPVLELGRSCVASGYRTRATLQMLWRGIATYVFHHGINLMFGCASLPGTDVDELAVPLSYLYQVHLAPPELRARALPGRRIDMARLPARAIDARLALGRLPPLIKGYLRLGGCVGDGAVIDRQFNTTDVCVVVRTEDVTEKYLRHFERGGSDADATAMARLD
jgi:putative hemolysin